MIDEDTKVIDSEGYSKKKDEGYSHQALVMSATRKCCENGSKEMRAGYWNEKADKFGNPIKTYIGDSRLEFIESVKSLKMIMSGDLDKEAVDNIKIIQAKIKTLRSGLEKDEENYWLSLNVISKKRLWNSGILFKEGRLNKQLPYYQEYLDECIDLYRELFVELNNLAKRLDYYESGVFGEGIDFFEDDDKPNKKEVVVEEEEED